MQIKVDHTDPSLSFLISCLPERLRTLEYLEEIHAAAAEHIQELEARVLSLEIQLKTRDSNHEREMRRAYFEEPLDPDEYRM